MVWGLLLAVLASGACLLAANAAVKGGDSLVGKPLAQVQRVAIARALINDPKIVFADEPTSALDDSNTDIVIELLKSQAERHQATLVVVTHDQRLKDNFENQVLL